MCTLSLGYSPCPNDTFLFYPLVKNRVDTGGLRFHERLEDVETLNQLAMENTLDVCKVSWHAFAHLRDRYIMLRAGGAMGEGAAPSSFPETRWNERTCVAGRSPSPADLPPPR
jgi:1,4-dihydroxy-6-naphthoate synthase